MLKKIIFGLLLFAVGFAAGLWYFSRSEPKTTSVENNPDVNTEKKTVERPANSGEDMSESTEKKMAIQKSEPVEQETDHPEKQEIEEPEKQAISGEKTDTLPVTNDSVLKVSDKRDTVLIPEKGKLQSDEIVLNKNELIDVQEIPVRSLSGKIGAGSDQETQRILEEQSEIHTQQVNSVIVEYWQSPFNTLGYKMMNRKLVLYGLDIDEQANIFQFRDTLYLRNFNEFYQLRTAFNLRPLRVVDSTHAVFDRLERIQVSGETEE